MALGDLPGLILIHGGATRAQSVMAGLAALAATDDIVLVHDAARPFLNASTSRPCCRAWRGRTGHSRPARRRHLKRAAAMRSSPPARRLWRAQTPQAFRTAALNAAYAAWTDDQAPTDDAGVIEAAGGRVRLVAGDPMLLKLTYPEDFAMANGWRARPASPARPGRRRPPPRPRRRSLAVRRQDTLRQDADRPFGRRRRLHAITDAILGAIARGISATIFRRPTRSGRARPRICSSARRRSGAPGGGSLIMSTSR